MCVMITILPGLVQTLVYPLSLVSKAFLIHCPLVHKRISFNHGRILTRGVICSSPFYLPQFEFLPFRERVGKSNTFCNFHVASQCYYKEIVI